ncbi:MAG: hypothetical protein VYA53_07810 [Acidobacteriota bacterium]|nr:hypothetical protein [Acidobacteriota bacterium]
MEGKEGERTNLTRQFFKHYPDYLFCRTLAFNVTTDVMTRENAFEVLTKKVQATERNQEQITEKLDCRVITIQGNQVRIKDLSLREVMSQEDEVLTKILNFYLKHPHAHGRTKRTRLLPRFVRTMFLSVLIGHAKRRSIDLDYSTYFDMLTLL